MTDLNWSIVARHYLDAFAPQAPVVALIEMLKVGAPTSLSEGLSAEAAADAKPESCRFLLFAIRLAVADHALSDAELHELRHLARLLRVEDGDLLKRNRDEVRDLLVEELERLLEDRTVDPVEAVHKVKLQELLGLGYDQFITLTQPVIDQVILEFRQQLHPEGRTPLSGREAEWLQSKIAALDTVYRLRG